MAHRSPTRSSTKPAALPAPEELWLGPAQRAVLEHMFASGGHKHVDGPPSCGKTTLLRHAQSLRPGDVVLLAEGPRERPAEVLTALLASAGLGPWDLHETDQRNLLTMFLLQRRAEGKRIAVLVDDAHRFSLDAWREIERICLLKNGAGAVVELTAVTQAGEAPPFPIGPGMASHSMPALGPQELKGYLRWRIGRFLELTDEALKLAHTIGAGRYAAVDALCQQALKLRGEARAPIDGRTISAAARALADRRREPAGRAAAPASPAQPPTAASQPSVVPGGHLLVMYHENVIQRVPLRERLLLGRSPENDVPLGSAAVSRFHAVVVGTPEKFFVIDLNSKNGVLLNGTPISKVELCDQDILKIGPFQVRVVLDRAAQRPERRAHELPTAADKPTVPARPRRTQRSIRLIK